MILVLDSGSTPGAAAPARELGATLVRSGFVPPPEVEGLLARWLSVARRRIDAAGWLDAAAVELEPWDVVPSRE